MLELTFTAKLWKYTGKASWYFVTLPLEDANEIHFHESELHVTRGMVKTRAKVGDSQWETSLFKDKKSNSYLLPIKAAIRKKRDLEDGDTLTITLSL